MTTGRLVKLALRCPAATTGKCAGKVHIVKPAGPSKRFSIAAGKTKTVSLRLSRKLFKRLKSKGTLSVTLAITDHDGAGRASGQPRRKLKLGSPGHRAAASPPLAY